MNNNKESKDKRIRFRYDILLVLIFVILLIGFIVYMVGTSLDDVLNYAENFPFFI